MARLIHKIRVMALAYHGTVRGRLYNFQEVNLVKEFI